jgi:predicted solute-binding protein
LSTPVESPRKPRIAAVSYLNTTPLVWGMTHGKQQGIFDLDFYVPSACARQVETGAADLGIVPVAEMARMDLEAVPGTGIACDGAVRSILLISKVEPYRIRTVATDSGSRTSALLTRVVLAERYGAHPACHVADPNLERMLAHADAALLIGDSALRVDPNSIPHHVLDLGAEWASLTGLPMVFALWAGRRQTVTSLLGQEVARVFESSLDFGLSRLNTIIEEESRARGFDRDLVARYLGSHIQFRIGPRHLEGLRTYLEKAATLEATLAPSPC